MWLYCPRFVVFCLYVQQIRCQESSTRLQHWLQVLDVLNSSSEDADTKSPVISVSSFAKIIERECTECSPEVQNAMLQFFHQLGAALNFGGVPIVKDFVVSDPQWLIDALCRVICNLDLHHQSHRTAAYAENLSEDWDDFKNKSVVSQSLLKKVLWKDKDYTEEIRVFFIELMKMLCLACQWSPRESNNDPQYLVPCLLRRRDDDTALSLTGESRVHIFKFSFSCR